MKTTITYEFSVSCLVNKNGDNDPDTYMGQTTIKYDFEAPITINVLKEYFKSCVGTNTFKSWAKDQQYGFERAIELVWQEDVICGDYLLENDDFTEWLKDYYEDDARIECEEYYEE